MESEQNSALAVKVEDAINKEMKLLVFSDIIPGYCTTNEQKSEWKKYKAIWKDDKKSIQQRNLAYVNSLGMSPEFRDFVTKFSADIAGLSVDAFPEGLKNAQTIYVRGCVYSTPIIEDGKNAQTGIELLKMIAAQELVPFYDGLQGPQLRSRSGFLHARGVIAWLAIEAGYINTTVRSGILKLITDLGPEFLRELWECYCMKREHEYVYKKDGVNVKFLSFKLDIAVEQWLDRPWSKNYKKRQ